MAVTQILRPISTLGSTGWTPNGAATLEECLDESYSTGPVPIGDGTDTTFASCFNGAFGIFKFSPITTVGTITKVTLRAVNSSQYPGGPPPAPCAFQAYFFNGILEFTLSESFVPNTIEETLLLSDLITGLSINTTEFDLFTIQMSVGKIVPGPSSNHKTWSFELEIEITPAPTGGLVVPDIFKADIAGQLAKGLGNLVFDITLIVVSPGTRGVNLTDGVQPTEISYLVKGFVANYDESQIDGTIIQKGDRMVVILGATLPVGVLPKTNDKIIAEGNTGVIGKIKRDPAGATYECQWR